MAGDYEPFNFINGFYRPIPMNSYPMWNTYANPILPPPIPSMTEMIRRYMMCAPEPLPRIEIVVRPDPTKMVASQARHHRRHRIDMKWRKRYGVVWNRVPDTHEMGVITKMLYDNVETWFIYRTTYDRFIKAIPSGVNDSFLRIPVREMPY